MSTPESTRGDNAVRRYVIISRMTVAMIGLLSAHNPTRRATAPKKNSDPIDDPANCDARAAKMTAATTAAAGNHGNFWATTRGPVWACSASITPDERVIVSGAQPVHCDQTANPLGCHASR